MPVLVVNCGSSSLKYALYDSNEHLLLSGKHERLVHDDGAGQSHAEAMAAVIEECHHHQVNCVGHRVVHGGDYHTAQTINDDVIAAIERFVPAAPMHNPFALAAIEAAKSVWPDVPQVAVFDTSLSHEDATPRTYLRY